MRDSLGSRPQGFSSDMNTKLGRRAILRLSLAGMTAVWLFILFALPPTGTLTSAVLGTYLLLPLAVTVLFFFTWYDAWFRLPSRFAPPRVIAPFARGFFWLGAAAFVVVFVMIYVKLVF